MNASLILRLPHVWRTLTDFLFLIKLFTKHLSLTFEGCHLSLTTVPLHEFHQFWHERSFGFLIYGSSFLTSTSFPMPFLVPEVPQILHSWNGFLLHFHLYFSYLFTAFIICLSYFPYKAINTFICYFSFVHSIRWLVSVFETLCQLPGTQWQPEPSMSCPHVAYSPMWKTNTNKKINQEVNTKYKCCKERKLKAAWRMD